MQKIVINRCFGGYGLSKEAQNLLGIDSPFDFDKDRSNPKLVTVVEKLGDKASGMCAELEVIEIPDGVEWTIEEYDGVEWVAEKHRTWP